MNRMTRSDDEAIRTDVLSEKAANELVRRLKTILRTSSSNSVLQLFSAEEHDAFVGNTHDVLRACPFVLRRVTGTDEDRHLMVPVLYGTQPVIHIDT
jgi:hypothetical protein